MPGWWGRKSAKKITNDPQLNSPKSPSSVKNERIDRSDRPRSIGEVSGMVDARNSPRTSRDFSSARGSSGLSGSASASAFMDTRLPLPQPQPSVSSFGNDHGLGFGFGSGSDSGSSVSSSASCDDHNRIDRAQFTSLRGVGDNKQSPVSQSPVRSRAPTTNSSPRHPHSGGANLDSPTGRTDEWKSECHRLPLPPGSPTLIPGSPTSPSTLSNPRTFFAEGSNGNLSKWKKGRLLGRGTFGHVYLGFNSENGQMCAIKEVRVAADDRTSKECLKQLNQEITLLSQFLHPSIVQYYGSELGEETLSVYLEYVSGGSIHKLLQEYGPFKEAVIQNYVRQILSGLAYLHARNTVHRDIKGANILVDPNGEIKLADFGMAKHITSCSSMLSFKGSPYWMAPEVVMNTNGYSLAVDIWSLGCTILEMATSKPPWSQYEGVAAIFKIGNSKDMPAIPDHLSSEAKCFIRLCLQREPSARPTASQLLEHPFIKDQNTSKVAHHNVINDVQPRSFDGSCTPPALELLHPSQRNFASLDGDYAVNPMVTVFRPMISSRDNAKTITSSLPVSPCSSPLRHSEAARRSCYLSPPHPSYHPFATSQFGNNHPEYSSTFAARVNTRNSLDPWLDIPQYRTQTPGRSSTRTMPIL
ncbi:mitogen-activated protein kinase kinase kinase 3-like [Ipomoea triloba]|uniref:mitogen-activated protein kinase kinase kinase 3-like n=1 Tax=Ipomoea triloba TaxID=35885 RepID=UPI00125E5ECC|nr:mitogen-activated protein kinase kinase kinase 3-like [Ipomoea triloba]